METILGHNSMINNETYATGLVRPKTTALFFDKIFLPEYITDKHVAVSLKLNIDSAAYSSSAAERILDMEVLFARDHRNAKSLDEYFSYWNLQYDELNDEQRIIIQKWRNEGISSVVTEVKKMSGIDVIPIYLNQSLFSVDYKEIDTSLISEENKSASNIIAFCINQFPEIVEDKLEWNQVLEVRRDKDSNRKLKRFLSWVSTELLYKNENEVIETLNKSLDDYLFALKKHGILTTVGGISTVLTATTTILDALAQKNFLSAGIAITAGIFVFTTEKAVEYNENRRNPIAYVYDIIKEAK